ncbi:hypothetical protein VTL71DRAFT_15457 [Oculimacula yallundae]|uniref:Secreted protein n=1 Tax=Oculimacula yallundae TaxID=86028 RepID=A0ABR4CH92_9HELO
MWSGATITWMAAGEALSVYVAYWRWGPSGVGPSVRRAFGWMLLITSGKRGRGGARVGTGIRIGTSKKTRHDTSIRLAAMRHVLMNERVGRPRTE